MFGGETNWLLRRLHLLRYAFPGSPLCKITKLDANLLRKRCFVVLYWDLCRHNPYKTTKPPDFHLEVLHLTLSGRLDSNGKAEERTTAEILSAGRRPSNRQTPCSLNQKSKNTNLTPKQRADRRAVFLFGGCGLLAERHKQNKNSRVLNSAAL